MRENSLKRMMKYDDRKRKDFFLELSILGNKKKSIQLDIWVPEHNLALEYQGSANQLSLIIF